MKINYMDGTSETDNGSLDFNLEEKMTSYYKPAYKPLYEDQKLTSKRLFTVTAVMTLILFGVSVGSHYLLKSKEARIKTLEGLYISAMDESEARRKVIGQNENTIASLSAEIKMSRLTSTARKHMEQKPEVVDAIKQTFGEEWVEAVQLLSNESSLDQYAVNPSSGACSLFQRLPCTAMVNECALSDLNCQMKNGSEYINKRYGSVTKALEFWNNKKATTGSGWY